MQKKKHLFNPIELNKWRKTCKRLQCSFFLQKKSRFYALQKVRVSEIGLTDSTGGAFKQLVPVALGAGGVAEDALALQHELPARTLRRRFASNKSDAVEEDQKRGEGAHGCSRTFCGGETGADRRSVSKDAVSVPQVRWWPHQPRKKNTHTHTNNLKHQLMWMGNEGVNR